MKTEYPRKIDEVLWHSATFFLLEINLRINAQASHNPGNRVPIHLDQIAFSASARFFWFG